MPAPASKRWLRIGLRVGIPMACALVGVGGGYLYYLFGQLERAFQQENEFVPTRIYSDLSKIASPEPRSQIEARLSSLGYTPQSGAQKVEFTLHPISYPSYLLPEGHPTLGAGGKKVTLSFDAAGPGALLQSIQVEQEEQAELYLEPELIATLSRGGVNDEGRKEIRGLLKFADVPAPIVQAILAVEDPHFLEHSGLDPRGIARAIWVNLKTLSLAQGGSTVTAQLVKNLMARRDKNVFRKANELLLALLLETRFSKQEIMERYLNEVYFGQVGNFEVHGVEQGAKHFFGKRVEDLNLGESAFMAGLIRGPWYYSPYRHRDRADERQRFVLKKMVENGYIAQAEAEAALAQPIRLAPPQTSLLKAPYFVDFVKAELIRRLKDKLSEDEISAASLRVYTTVDMTMNQAGQRAVANGIDALEAKLGIQAPVRLEGALAAVDQSTGFVRALIGGRSYAQSTFNRILNTKRQVGSTFKPLVYLSAFRKGEDPQGVPYSPGYPAEDGPWKLVYDKRRQSWTPKNYEPKFLGWISFRTALAHSVNTVAAKLGVEVGTDAVIKTARDLGIESELPAVPSLSLGVAELSPIELLRAYATVANHGKEERLQVIRAITHDNGSDFERAEIASRDAIEPGAADLLTDMLQNVFVDGTARDAFRLGFDRPAAGKTGTTSHHRDAWFAGYTPQLTAVVWVGADTDAKEAKPPGKLTGANSALPIWVSFMKDALAADPPSVFPISAHVTAAKIDKHTGGLASDSCPDEQVLVEKFVVGHEPKTEGCESNWPGSIPQTTLD